MKIEEDPRRRGTTSVKVTMSWDKRDVVDRGVEERWVDGVVVVVVL